MNKYYFTFGVGQLLTGHVVIIEAENEGDARALMAGQFGTRWCWCYDEQRYKERDIARHNYTEIIPKINEEMRRP